MSAFLLDTHLLLWAIKGDARLPPAARDILQDSANGIAFSAASIWEIAIKAAMRKPNFLFDPLAIREALIGQDFEEVEIAADHAIRAARLPAIHRDPFDRMLVAQAVAEKKTLLTVDRNLARYPGPVRLLG